MEKKKLNIDLGKLKLSYESESDGNSSLLKFICALIKYLPSYGPVVVYIVEYLKNRPYYYYFDNSFFYRRKYEFR